LVLDGASSSHFLASVLMPVFGYLLLLNENVHQYLFIQYDHGWPFNYLPSLWRVWMLFYGSFFLAIGSIIFGWKCPVEIKRYPSQYILVDSERPHLVAHGQSAPKSLRQSSGSARPRSSETPCLHARSTARTNAAASSGANGRPAMQASHMRRK